MTATMPPDSPMALVQTFRHKLTFSISTEGSKLFGIETKGDFVAPNRFTCQQGLSLGFLTLPGDSVTVIGKDAWINDGDGYRATDDLDESVAEITNACLGAARLWQQFPVDLSSLKESEAILDTRNGVEALLFDLSESLDVVEPFGPVAVKAEGESIKEFKVWLDKDGGWLAGMSITIVTNAEALEADLELPDVEVEEGQEFEFNVSAEISDVNAPGIEVNPPSP